MRRWNRIAALASVVATCAAGCMGGPLPETHYYALVPPRPMKPAPVAVDGASLVVEELEADPIYADDRVVYRTSPYRLGYYEYHRWTAIPAIHVADYLQTALTRTGRFARVTRELADDAAVSLSGRITAFEEVDLAENLWMGRIELQLYVEDVRTREMLWSRTFREEEPLVERTPEALAQALSVIMARIVAAAAPQIADSAAAVHGQEFEVDAEEP